MNANRNSKTEKPRDDQERDRKGGRPATTHARNTRKRKKKVETVDTSRDSREVRRDYSENDPAWYAASEQLLVDAYSLSTPERLGAAVRSDIPNMSATVAPFVNDVLYELPGIINLLITPCPGISNTPSSAINVASRKLFANIRKSNSGFTNYEPADLMLYMCAMDSAYTLWNWLVRLYGIINVYSVRNMYMPDGLLEAMRVSKNVKQKMNDLRTLINTFASQLNAMRVPTHAGDGGKLSYFTRHAWLFGNVYRDSDNSKAQLYMYNPYMLHRLVEQTEALEPSYLEPVEICGTQSSSAYWDIDGLRGLVNSFIEPIFYSADFSTMSGDIEKAVGIENCFKIPEINADYVLYPEYSPEVLTQIENATIAIDSMSKTPFGSDFGDNLDTWRITQYDAAGAGEARYWNLQFDPQIAINYGLLESNRMYNFHVEQPSPGLVSVATRLNLVPLNSTVYHPENSAQAYAYLWSTGTEIVNIGEILTLHPGSHSYTKTYISSHKVLGLGDDDQRVQTIANMLCERAQLDWSPILKVALYYSDDTPAKIQYMGDLDNFTQIHMDKMVAMNDVALLSMFGVS